MMLEAERFRDIRRKGCPLENGMPLGVKENEGKPSSVADKKVWYRNLENECSKEYLMPED